MSAARAAFSSASALSAAAFSVARAVFAAAKAASAAVLSAVRAAAAAATASASALSDAAFSAVRAAVAVANAAFSAATAASDAAFSAVRAAFSAASAAVAFAISPFASVTSMKVEIALTAGSKPATSTAGIETDNAACPAVDGYVRVNSDTPSAFDEVAVVEVKLIGVIVGLTPTTGFPKTSVTLTLCFTSVEVNGFAFGV